MSKEVLLALGGGGIRGIAHVGVIKCLVENDYKIAGIAGTSAGGLFGCMFASGVGFEKIEAAVAEFSASPSFKRRSADSASLIGTIGLEKAIQGVLGNVLLEDFPIPFVATAVDLLTGNEIVIKTGPALRAILSTIALPGVFPSQEFDQYKLIDGGIVDPVPVRAARELDPTLPIIAVRLSRKPDGYVAKELTLPFQDTLPTSITDRLYKTRLAESLRTYYQSIDVLTGKLEAVSLSVDLPDVIVAPEIGHYPTLDMVIPPDLQQKGYDAMLAALPQLEQSLSLVNKVRRIAKYVVADPKINSLTSA
ncbi:MAG: patatin-like phospholipase family protein [Anaerolineaceae bacterium]